jgi:hypothetical protein
MFFCSIFELGAILPSSGVGAQPHSQVCRSKITMAGTHVARKPHYRTRHFRRVSLHIVKLTVKAPYSLGLIFSCRLTTEGRAGARDIIRVDMFPN